LNKLSSLKKTTWNSSENCWSHLAHYEDYLDFVDNTYLLLKFTWIRLKELTWK